MRPRQASCGGWAAPPGRFYGPAATATPRGSQQRARRGGQVAVGRPPHGGQQRGQGVRRGDDRAAASRGPVSDHGRRAERAQLAAAGGPASPGRRSRRRTRGGGPGALERLAAGALARATPRRRRPGPPARTASSSSARSRGQRLGRLGHEHEQRRVGRAPRRGRSAAVARQQVERRRARRSRRRPTTAGAASSARRTRGGVLGLLLDRRAAGRARARRWRRSRGGRRRSRGAVAGQRRGDAAPAPRVGGEPVDEQHGRPRRRARRTASGTPAPSTVGIARPSLASAGGLRMVGMEGFGGTVRRPRGAAAAHGGVRRADAGPAEARLGRQRDQARRRP